MDTFASEIGREACLIDRLTLSLREPDVYALKYRMLKPLPMHFLRYAHQCQLPNYYPHLPVSFKKASSSFELAKKSDSEICFQSV